MRLDHLRVKVKSLAAESTIIRNEERKARTADRRCALAAHRRGTVRREARSSLLAYGFLRGRPYRAMELKCHDQPDWSRVKTIANSFGGGNFDNELKVWRSAEDDAQDAGDSRVEHHQLG